MKHVIRVATFFAAVSLTSMAMAQTTPQPLTDAEVEAQALEAEAQAFDDAVAAEDRALEAERAQQSSEAAQQRAADAAEESAAASEANALEAEQRAIEAEQRAADAAAAEERAAVADERAAEAAAAAAASAAAAAAIAEEAEEVDPGYYEGRWVGALGISGSFNLTSLNRVPGAPKGVSVGLNISADGVLDYLKGKHEWRNSLNLGAGLLRSASDAIWVKTNDVLKLQSGYYFAVTNWFGPFAEFQFQTSMFPMVVRRNAPTRFCGDSGEVSLESCEDGTVPFVEDEKLKISGAFQPIQMHEKFGLFLRPVDRTYFRVAIRTGFGAQQFYASHDAYIETNRNASGTAITLREMNTYGLFGFIADMNIRGAAKSEGVLYGANAALLVPFVDTSKDRRADEGVNGMQVDLGAFVTFKIADWASLDVRGAAARVPQVTGNKWQTSIQTLLTFSYAVVGDLDTAREDATTLRGGDFQGATGEIN